MADFDERFKDINVEEVVIFEDGSWQVNGHDLDGRHVWILLHMEDVRFRHHISVVEEEEQEVSNNGFCEDYPCCGHEWGDCFGQKYGSDESIKAAAVERMRMEDEGYFFDGEDG
jgi:hypothetical protein